MPDDIWIGILRNAENKIVSIEGYVSFEDCLSESDAKVVARKAYGEDVTRTCWEVMVHDRAQIKQVREERARRALRQIRRE